MEDENLRRSYKNFSKNKKVQSIVTIISNLGYAVFGPLLPSKDSADDIENVDIRDMPGLKSEEDAAKRLATIKKISKTSNKEEPPKVAKIGEGLKIMTPNQLLTNLVPRAILKNIAFCYVFILFFSLALHTKCPYLEP